MKKILSIVFALVLSMNMLLFVSACGNDEKGNNNENYNSESNNNANDKENDKNEAKKETVIDLGNEETYPQQDGEKLSINGLMKKYFSIDFTPDLQPVKKSSFYLDLVEYSATGTLTVTFEPVSIYKMRLEDVKFDLQIILTYEKKNDREWKFTSGGDSENNNHRKTVSVSLPANGKKTITEKVKMDFLVDPLEATFVDVNNLSTLKYVSYIIYRPQGKIVLINE